MGESQLVSCTYMLSSSQQLLLQSLKLEREKPLASRVSDGRCADRDLLGIGWTKVPHTGMGILPQRPLKKKKNLRPFFVLSRSFGVPAFFFFSAW